MAWRRHRGGGSPLRAWLLGATLLGATVVTPAIADAARPDASPVPWNGNPGYSYPSRQTDQLGVPGTEAAGMVTPEGDIFTGSVEVRPWMGTGRPGVPARRGLPEPVAPLYATAPGSASGGAVAWWASEVAGVPSGVMLLRPARGRRAGVALRWGGTKRPGAKPPEFRFARPATPDRTGLYSQPGEPFRAGACWSVIALGRSAVAVVRDEHVVAVLSGLAAGGRSPMPGVRTTPCARQPGAWAATVAARPRPGRSQSVGVIVPMVPIPADDPRLEQIAQADLRAIGREHVEHWRSGARRAARLTFPEAPVQRALEAATTSILVPRYRTAVGEWVQAVNTLQYHAYWIRDAVLMGHALDLVGRSGEAREDLEYLRSWQLPDGCFQSRPNQNDGCGQALWGLGRHVKLTGDVEFASDWVPAVKAAVDGLRGRLNEARDGLLPASDPGDNEMVHGQLTGDNLWAVAGLDGAATLAAVAGDPKLQASAVALREQLRARIVARASALAGERGRLHPTLDNSGGYRWGELWAAWPYPVFSPTDPLVQHTMRAAVAGQREGVATWHGGDYLHLYSGFRVWQTLLRGGEQTVPIKGLYATLAHLSATGAGFETSVRPYQRRRPDQNLAPHGWLSAELVTFLRDMIVREQDGGLVLMGALPNAWLAPGKVTRGERLPTDYGQLDVRLKATARGARLEWRLARRPEFAGAAIPLSMTLPPAVRSASITGAGQLAGRQVLLSGDAGVISLRWKGRLRPGPSLGATIAQLQREYARRGKVPPH